MTSTAIIASRARVATTLGDLLISSAERWPDREVLIFPYERLTYAELRDRAWTLALGLNASGIGLGDNVGILMLNAPEYVLSLFAVAMTGATAVPINARYRAPELKALIKNAEPAAIITHDRHDDYLDLGGLLIKALAGLDRSRPALMMFGEARDGFMSTEEIARRSAEADAADLTRRASAISLRSVAAIVYTSGTTSAPRGAMITHEALVGGWALAADRLELDETSRFWVPVPLFHIAAIGPLVSTVARGGSFISASHFDAGRGIRQIVEERATGLYPCYPPITEALINHPDFARADLSSVKFWVNVAPPETLMRMESAIPNAALISCYGSTESGATVLGSPSDTRDNRIHTCGTPLESVELRIVDPDTGAHLARGEVGEILTRGFCNFSGYWSDPASTDAMVRKGWIHTGDRGSIDISGYVYFYGRLKEMLKVGGENVAPAEVEEALTTHPGVKLARAVGIPDARLTEVVAAFVELKESAVVDEDELIAHCRKRLASFKVPRLIRVVDSWPMSATKIQGDKLRAQLIEELAAKGDGVDGRA